ncbi:conjugal transfer protein TraG N-terminal domain-containing protein [Methyloversatilis discipulorum]|uniref:conjugal transfer protein TraG N-terminal domain-containing protein n=1 Tax=Methyloversatilis discipulorum TaxID=1119528 RepID=UPI003F40C638
MFEIYAYGNVDTLTGVFNAIAAIMGGADYFGLIKAIAITGVLVAAFAGLFTPGKFHGWGWLMGFLLVYYALFLPKSTVVIVDKLGSQPPVAVGNVPIGVAFFGHATSKVGDVMTRFFETAFQVIPATNAQLPNELAYQKNGVMFGNRLIQASRAANVADPQLRTDLIAFVHNCTVYDLQDGTIDPAAFARSTDIWSLMGTPNPARFTTYGNPVQVETCPNAYTYLAARLPAEVAHARSILAFQLNPTLEPAAALTAIDAQVEQAYYKTKIATAAQGAADLLRQNIMINLVQDSRSLAGQKLNDPAALMIATTRANATASVNSAFLTMGKIAEQALPLVRNVIEAVIYAVFPFVFLLFLLAQGRGLAMAIKSFAMSLVWIQLWPPLYAILNYVATLASARNLEAAAKMGTVAQGLALETAASIYSGAVSDQAIAGYMVISIPIIATAIIKGGEVAFQAVTGVGAVQSAASSEAAATSKGSITQNAVSMDQQQLAPTRSSAFMSTTSDAYGTTIQGSGPDAGVFRYQANLSRLASTFTFTERQANALGESAREAETLARTEREAMQRSQATALTRALGIQDSYERSQQRSGATSTSDGGSFSSQLQTLSSVAKDVNRKLGLSEDSTVGKSIAAAASAGAKIPLTEIGGQLSFEGRKVDQQRLQSAYDYARKAVESSQLTEASALIKDFRTSDAYQWARGNRTVSTTGYDSVAREATERQTSSDSAYGQARELARTAQFMREWSSGTQTDFTNYAARRLAERGLLREDDPIKLQRAVTEIAYSYARGGSSASGYVPSDSPLVPSRPLPETMGWPDSSMREQYDSRARAGDGSAIREQTATNEGELRARQTRRRAVPGQPVGNDLSGRVSASEAEAKNTIDKGRTQLSQDAGTLSETYKASVRIGKVSPNHGGTRAVWDTVGANASQPDLGTPPKVEPIGEWHFGKDGVPVAGPKPQAASPAASPSQTSGMLGSGQSTKNEGIRGKP